MFITPSFKKSLIVEQFQGNYLKLSELTSFLLQPLSTIYLKMHFICKAIHSPFYSHLNKSLQLALCQTGGAPDSTMAITNITTVDKQSLFIN